VDLLAVSLIYLLPFAAGLVLYATLKKRASRKANAIWQESREAGLTEPASLHPKIDLSLCCGSAACVSACPEKTVIGVVNGKAQLIDPTACIGHGACAAACPTQAITLVFGAETRGVELPTVSPDFQTNVPGLFIAGELGGMGLIRNAVSQGVQAIDAIARLPGVRRDDRLDVIIVGAGPAGFAASLAAKEKGLRFKTIEQESFGGTVSHFPRNKLVMTQPARLPLVGQMKFREVSKETLLAFWKEAKERTGIEISYQERLEGLERSSQGFLVRTSRGEHRARAVLLAIGRRGTPRKLGVPGEDLSKVVYRLIDPQQFVGMHVLVVGGGDSALEAAATLAEETDATVTLSYRGDAFMRARRRNRGRVEQAASSGRLSVRLKSEVEAITARAVRFRAVRQESEILNDAVIVCAGGVLPTDLLRSMGIDTVTKYGEA
jgi:thioredoxin reductase/NAD-dependent dihydropyrimidine dehydrogenase PreA subunit